VEGERDREERERDREGQGEEAREGSSAGRRVQGGESRNQRDRAVGVRR
jgi:hypothetical protein